LLAPKYQAEDQRLVWDFSNSELQIWLQSQTSMSKSS